MSEIKNCGIPDSDSVEDLPSLPSHLAIHVFLFLLDQCSRAQYNFNRICRTTLRLEFRVFRRSNSERRDTHTIAILVGSHWCSRVTVRERNEMTRLYSIIDKK